MVPERRFLEGLFEPFGGTPDGTVADMDTWLDGLLGAGCNAEG